MELGLEERSHARWGLKCVLDLGCGEGRRRWHIRVEYKAIYSVSLKFS